MATFEVNIPRLKKVFLLHKFELFVWHLLANIFQLLLAKSREKIDTVFSPINPAQFGE